MGLTGLIPHKAPRAPRIRPKAHSIETLGQPHQNERRHQPQDIHHNKHGRHLRRHFSIPTSCGYSSRRPHSRFPCPHQLNARPYEDGPATHAAGPSHDGLPHLDSNQDKGFQRPVCCHYTMGERRARNPPSVYYATHFTFDVSRRRFSSIMAMIPALFPEWMPVFRPSTQGAYARRRGSLGRDAPGRCRTVRRRNRPRTPRGWRWPAAARWKARSGRPNASRQGSERCR